MYSSNKSKLLLIFLKKFRRKWGFYLKVDTLSFYHKIKRHILMKDVPFVIFSVQRTICVQSSHEPLHFPNLRRPLKAQNRYLLTKPRIAQ